MLRWWPLFWVLSIPAVPLKPDPAQISTAEPPRRFDQSLEQLERSRVITPLERQGLEAGQPQAPIDVSLYQKACREGALSREECAFTPSSVPVSALLAGSAASYSLDSFFAVTPRPAPHVGNGDTRLLFPVIGQAITSSGFGWRLHPILGNWLMHAGRDFAAPQGTPVVAALSGRVVSSGLAGGYGITVVLEHDKPKRRTLYGHLSEIYVKAGQKVQQGEVIGRVGSTGLSTGPHLHFELRRPDGDGWVAMDPKDLDMGGLVDTMKADGKDPVSILMAQLLRSLERPGDVKPTPPAG